MGELLAQGFAAGEACGNIFWKQEALPSEPHLLAEQRRRGVLKSSIKSGRKKPRRLDVACEAYDGLDLLRAVVRHERVGTIRWVVHVD